LKPSVDATGRCEPPAATKAVENVDPGVSGAINDDAVDEDIGKGVVGLYVDVLVTSVVEDIEMGVDVLVVDALA